MPKKKKDSRLKDKRYRRMTKCFDTKINRISELKFSWEFFPEQEEIARSKVTAWDEGITDVNRLTDKERYDKVAQFVSKNSFKAFRKRVYSLRKKLFLPEACGRAFQGYMEILPKFFKDYLNFIKE